MEWPCDNCDIGYYPCDWHLNKSNCPRVAAYKAVKEAMEPIEKLKEANNG